MAKVTGRVYGIVYTGKVDFSGVRSSFCVLRFLNEDTLSSEIVSGNVDLRPGPGSWIEFEGELTDTKYGEQWVLNDGSIIHVDPLKDNRSLAAYLTNPYLFPELDTRSVNMIVRTYGVSFAEKIISDPDEVAKKCCLSKDAVACLLNGVSIDFPVVFIENEFPSMKRFKNMAHKIVKFFMGDSKQILSKESVDAICNSIRKSPYTLVVKSGVPIKEIDYVAQMDLNVDVADVGRGLASIYCAVRLFVEDFHCTYVRLTDENESRLFASQYLTEQRLGIELPVSLKYKPYVTINGDAGLFNWYNNILLRYILCGVNLQSGKSLTYCRSKDDWLVLESSSGNGLVRFDLNAGNELRLYMSNIYDYKDTIASICSDYYHVQNCVSPASAVFKKAVTSRKKCLKNYCANSGNNAWLQITPEQLNAVKTSISNNMSFISGGPGRGKSFTIQCLADFWRNGLGLPVACFAPTGQATDRLKSFVRDTASCETVKRFITINSVHAVDKNDSMLYVGGQEILNKSSLLVIVDEVSMLDFEDASEFLSYVNGATIVFVGDPDQLPPVGIGPFLFEMLKSGLFAVSVLTKNFRADALRLATNADIVRDGCVLKNLKYYDDPINNEVFMYSSAFDDNTLIEKALDYYGDFMGSEPDATTTLLLAPTRKVCYQLNVRLQAKYNVQRHSSSPLVDVACPACMKDNGTFEIRSYYDTYGYEIPLFNYSERLAGTKVTPIKVRIGDRVINTKNHATDTKYRLDSAGRVVGKDDGVYNGDRGIVTRYYTAVNDVSEVFVEVKLDSGYVVYVPYDRLHEWKLAYALTVHRAQGGEAKNVIVAFPSVSNGFLFDTAHGGKNPMLSRNLFYTAITRAKKNVIILGNNEVIDRALGIVSIPYNVALSETVQTLCA